MQLQETGARICLICDAAKISGKRIQPGCIKLRPVLNIQCVHPDLESNTFLNAEITLHIHVPLIGHIASHIVDTSGEYAAMERRWSQCRSSFKLTCIKPAVKSPFNRADLIKLPVIKQIAPIEQRARLPFVGCGRLESAGNVVQ